jgi:hypothetical protein
MPKVGNFRPPAAHSSDSPRAYSNSPSRLAHMAAFRFFSLFASEFERVSHVQIRK